MTLESLIDMSLSVNEDPSNLKIALDHAHELWSFLAEGMPSTANETDAGTTCRKERWRRAVEKVSFTEDSELAAYQR